MKPTKGLLISVDGTVKDITVSSLEDMQKAIGGYVEGLYPDRCSLYIDEDGIANNKPYNATATSLCTHLKVGLAKNDYIKGDMLVLGVVRVGYDCDLTKKVRSEILEFVKAKP